MSNEYQDIETTIRDYISGSLPEEEHLKFEEYFMSNPEVAEMVRGSVDMQLGLKAHAMHDPDSSEEVRDSFVSIAIRKLSDWLTVPVPVFAPLVVIAALSSFLSLQAPMQSDQQTGHVELVGFTTAPSRGVMNEVSGPINELQLNLTEQNSPAAVLLKIHKSDVSMGPYFAVVTEFDSHEKLWISSGLEPNGLRDLLVVLPPETEGLVRLRVSQSEESHDKTLVRFCHYSEVCQ